MGGVGDLDNDGLPEMVATAPYDDTRDVTSGQVYVDFSDQRAMSRWAATESDEPYEDDDGDFRSQQRHSRSRLTQLMQAWLEGALLADVDGNDVVNDADLDLILLGDRSELKTR